MDRRAPQPGGYREVWRVAFPIVLSTASFTVMQFIDRLFLAWHSEVALRAALPAGMLALTLTMFFQSLAGYSATFVAQWHGAGKPRECARAAWQGVWMALATWPLCFLLVPAGHWLLGLAGHEPAMLAAERSYYAILTAAGGLFALSHVFAGFFSGRGDTVTPLWANVAGNGLNVVLDYALVFGHWGFPRLGIAGAAWGTVLAGAFSAAWLAVRFAGARNRRDCGILAEWRPRRRGMADLCRFGVPGAVHAVLDIASFALFLVVVGRLPARDVAVNNIAFSVNNIAFMPLMGMGIAAQILVGQYQGARDSASAVRAASHAMKMAWFYAGALSVSFLLFPRFYLGLFARGGAEFGVGELMEKGRWLLAILAGWGMVDAMTVVLSGALKGAGDTRFVLLFSVLSNWLLWMPGIFLLARWCGDGALLPQWVWMMAIVLLMGFGFGRRFRSGRWRKIEMIRRT
ncbi:MAG: MATE family efflux transporter [Kiritimatiellae bacterium]|nr:MATE family efflux transporter [Kiritimatiellia bacterium]